MSGITKNLDAFANLKPKQRKFLRYLAAEPDSITKAAEKAGITANTAIDWLKRDPNLRAALAEAEYDLFQELARKQLGVSRRAIEKLSELLDDDSISVPQKIRAIDTALTHTAKFYGIVLQVQMRANDTSTSGDSEWIAAEDGGHGQQDTDDDDDSSNPEP